MGERNPELLCHQRSSATAELWRICKAGKVYYGLLGIPVPKLYSYETPLINDQWVTGFSGRKVLVRRRLADGSWRMRKQGEAYFVANRDEVVVTVPTVLVMSLRDFSAGARARFDPVAH